MTTFVQLSDENEPIVDLAVLIDSIIKTKQKKGKGGTKKKETETKTSETEEGDEESEKEDKGEEDESEKDKGEKDDDDEGEKDEGEKDEEDDEETEKPQKKEKPKKKEKAKEESKEESALIAQAKTGRPLNFLEQVFIPNLNQILEATPAEAEAAWEIATAVLEHIIEHDEHENEEDEEPVVDEETLASARKLVMTLANLISKQNVEDKKTPHLISLKLRCLLTLYNTFKADPIPQQLFIQVLRYAIWSENGSLLVNSLNEIEQTIRTTWKPKLTELREIYLLLSQIFAQANKPSETQKYRLAYLKTFESGKDSKELEQAAEVAVSAIVTAISTANSVHYQILLNLKVTNFLSSHKDHGKIVRLLTIFAKENVETYNKFYSENTPYIKKLGLDHEANLRQIRALTICSLGLKQENVPYGDLMKTLQVDDEGELEEVVIDAVQQKKIEAKIDQETQQVLIERVSARVFEENQWKQMGEKLEAWKHELNRTLQSLQHAQQSPQTVSSQPQSRVRAS